MRRIIDSHLDIAWNALSFDRDLTLEVDRLRQNEQGLTDEPSLGRCTTSLPELNRANVRVCVGTLLARSSPAQDLNRHRSRTDLEHATQSIAHAAARGQLAYYRQLESLGHLQFITGSDELASYWSESVGSDAKRPPLGMILSMEGCDPITKPGEVEAWFNLGLRAAGPVHYGHSHYAAGTGVTGRLTDQGIELLREFDRLGVILDVTHLCDDSFDHAMELFQGHILASHHNCRSLVPGNRQLTDEQITRLIERGAVIGTALDAWMLYPGWQRGITQPSVVGMDAVADHIDHVCQLAGNAEHAAIGSDLDGGFGTEQTPHDLNTIADLHKLDALLAARGYSDGDIDGIFHGNWLRFFTNALPNH